MSNGEDRTLAMLRALNAAAAAVQQAAFGEEDVFRAVTDQLRHLGLRGGISTLDEARTRFTVRAVAFPVKALAALEKLTGFRTIGYTFPVGQVDVYRQVAESGHAVFVPDGSQVMAQLMPAPARRFTARAIEAIGREQGVFAPLIAGGQVVGLLAVVSTDLTEDDLPAMVAFANHVAVAIENARLYEAEQQQKAELARSNALIAALAQVAAQVEATTDPDQVLETLGAELERLGVTCLVALLEPDEHTMVVRYASIESDALALAERMTGVTARGFRISREFWPIYVELIEQGRALFEPDLMPWAIRVLPGLPRSLAERALRLAGVTRDARMINLPLTVEERVLGVLWVWGPNLEEGDMPAFSLFAGQVAAALEKARLYAEVEQRATELSILLEAARLASSTLDLEEMVTLIADQMTKAVDADGCTLSRWDPETDTAVTWIERRVWWREMADEPGKAYALDDFPATRAVLEERTPMAINLSDPSADPAEIALMREQEVGSLLMLPLATGERVIGLVELDYTRERHFTPAEIRLCQALAGQAAVAIEKARLHAALQAHSASLEEQVAERTAELRYRAGQLEHLRELSTSLLGAASLEETLRLVTEGAVTRLGYTVAAAALYLEAEAAFVIKAVHPLDSRVKRARTLLQRPEEIRLPVVGKAPGLKRVMAGEALVTTSLADILSPTVPQTVTVALQKLYNLNCLYFVPLLAEGGLVGTLMGSVRAAEISPQQQQGLEMLADQAALAIRQARLHEAEQQRSAELEQALAELRQTQEQLVQAERLAAMGELAAGVAHEINNPLKALENYLYLVQQDTPEDSPHREYLARARREVGRIGRITRQLTRFYGPAAREMAPVNLNELIEEVLALQGKTLAGQGIAVRRELAPDLPQLTVSPDQLKQVFLNLILNAAGAMAQGGTLTLRTGLEAEQKRVFAQVADTGVGIPEEDLGRIFEPFFTTREEGSGLGLWVCHDLMQRHGGTIEVESRLGEGSRFVVWLPMNSEQ